MINQNGEEFKREYVCMCVWIYIYIYICVCVELNHFAVQELIRL